MIIGGGGSWNHSIGNSVLRETTLECLTDNDRIKTAKAAVPVGTHDEIEARYSLSPDGQSVWANLFGCPQVRKRVRRVDKIYCISQK